MIQRWIELYCWATTERTITMIIFTVSSTVRHSLMVLNDWGCELDEHSDGGCLSATASPEIVGPHQR